MKNSRIITCVHCLVILILLFLSGLAISATPYNYDASIFLAIMLCVDGFYFTKYKNKVGKILTALSV